MELGKPEEGATKTRMGNVRRDREITHRVKIIDLCIDIVASLIPTFTPNLMGFDGEHQVVVDEALSINFQDWNIVFYAFP
jgi:hypothetical protein